MLLAFQAVVLAIGATFFIGVSFLLILAIIDKQKDTSMDNRIVAGILFIGLIVAPLIGVFSSFR